ncbi:MAG: hypothetical protein EBU90_02190 [Proteobacteria bacterium]|nr:hypothetical protein [Pseudomonadota bacterium]NBP13294.1 hypothetical protein [bacterium]
MILVDYREPDPKPFLLNTQFQVVSLAVGDFYITKSDTYAAKSDTDAAKSDTDAAKSDTDAAKSDTYAAKCEQGKIVYVIERKTLADLSSSVIDNRFREQRQRLLESVGDPRHVVYIIEQSEVYKGLSKSIIDSCIVNLIFKHKVNVIFSSSISDTYSKIALLHKKVLNGDLDTPVLDISVKTKGKKTIENILVHQLCVIPGVSVHIANAISMVYPNMSNLIESIKGNDLALQDIKVTDTRKVGKAISKKIYNCLIS